jgi:hypothetical protein
MFFTVKFLHSKGGSRVNFCFEMHQIELKLADQSIPENRDQKVKFTLDVAKDSNIDLGSKTASHRFHRLSQKQKKIDANLNFENELDENRSERFTSRYYRFIDIETGKPFDNIILKNSLN